MEKTEVARAAKEFYDAELKPQLEPEHIGKFLIIDVTNRDYEMDENSVQAGLRIMERHPNGQRFIMKIGYATAGRMGFRTVKRLC